MIGQHRIVWKHDRLPAKVFVLDFKLSCLESHLRPTLVGFVEVSLLLLVDQLELFDFFGLAARPFRLSLATSQQNSGNDPQW